jgi:hypothetical protein
MVNEIQSVTSITQSEFIYSKIKYNLNILKEKIFSTVYDLKKQMLYASFTGISNFKRINF